MSQATSWLKPRLTSSSTVNQFRSFYFLVSLLIAVVVVYGFAQTIRQNLIQAPVPRPWVLYLHAVVFFGWVALFVVQTALIQTRNAQTHRRLGCAGLVVGASIPLVGIVTALSMARFKILNAIATPDSAAAFLVVPINDMICFSASFVLAAE